MSAAQRKVRLSPQALANIRAAVKLARTGYVHSEESRRKMSQSKTGKKHSEETKQKMRLKALARELCKRETHSNTTFR